MGTKELLHSWIARLEGNANFLNIIEVQSAGRFSTAKGLKSNLALYETNI